MVQLQPVQSKHLTAAFKACNSSAFIEIPNQKRDLKQVFIG